MSFDLKSNTLERLGLRSWINASSWATNWGGNWLDERVLESMAEVGRTFVDIPQLMATSNERLAEVCGVDAAYVTSGAGAGIALSVAASMCGTDTAKWKALPDTSNLEKNEVAIPLAHRLSYLPQWKATGAKVYEYGQGGYLIRPTLDPPLGHYSGSAWIEELRSSVTDRTCCLGYVDSYYTSPGSEVPLGDVVSVAHANDLPVIVDAACQLPPVSRLTEYLDKGADIAIFSGGKGIRGPGNTGLVLARGKRGVALIDAMMKFGFPYHSVARHYKVSKEDIVGLVVATEIFVQEADSWYESQMRSAEAIRGALSDIPGLKCWIVPNDDSLYEHPRRVRVPRVRIEWDAGELGISGADLDKILAAEDPPIKIRAAMYGSMQTPDQVRTIDTYLLRDSEVEIVKDRVRKAFLSPSR